MQNDSLLIKNLYLAQISNNEINPIFCDLKIGNGRIETIIPKDFYEYVNNDTEEEVHENEYNAKGAVATIPLINFHEHIYSRLAKGLKTKGSFSNFYKILKNLWWKLDLILDEGMIEASAVMAAIESIKNGTTYIFDHHSSPNFTKDSLKTISETLSQFGLRGTICFETSDRNGLEITKKAVQENCDFIENNDGDFKGIFGLHAAFTLNDQTLRFVSNIMKGLDTGIHIHLCEDKVDREQSLKKFEALPLERLIKFNLINSKSILAHGVHLKKKEYKKIAEYEAAIALNPDSNMNNSVGIPVFKKFPENLTLLAGTDGMNSNIAKTLKQLFLLYRYSGESFDDSFKWIKKIYFNQLNFIKKYFDDFTTLNQNERADLIIWDYTPVNEMTYENFWGHFVYGILEQRPKTVIQSGKYLLKDFQLQFDTQTIQKEIIKQGMRLKEKFESS